MDKVELEKLIGIGTVNNMLASAEKYFILRELSKDRRTLEHLRPFGNSYDTTHDRHMSELHEAGFIEQVDEFIVITQKGYDMYMRLRR